MKEKINECYEMLQKLDIKPSRFNMEILLQVLYKLQDVYNQMNKEGEANAVSS